MKYQHLNESQRYEIKAYLNCNKSQKFIAEQLGVSPSCISRELKRNKLKKGAYNAKKPKSSLMIERSVFVLIGDLQRQ